MVALGQGDKGRRGASLDASNKLLDARRRATGTRSWMGARANPCVVGLIEWRAEEALLTLKLFQPRGWLHRTCELMICAP